MNKPLAIALAVSATLLSAAYLYQGTNTADSNQQATRNITSNATTDEQVNTARSQVQLVKSNPERDQTIALATPSLTKSVAVKTQHQAIEQLVNDTVNDKGVINLDVLSNTMAVDNFADVLTLLSQHRSEIELSRQNEIAQSILKDNLLASHNYNIACGKGLCALDLPDIPSDQLSEYRDRIKALDLGSSFQKILSPSESLRNMRIVTQSRREDTTTTSLHSDGISFKESTP